jgi:hypothetical protein
MDDFVFPVELFALAARAMVEHRLHSPWKRVNQIEHGAIKKD